MASVAELSHVIRRGVGKLVMERPAALPKIFKAAPVKFKLWLGFSFAL